jgi:hypothetical protein
VTKENRRGDVEAVSSLLLRGRPADKQASHRDSLIPSPVQSKRGQRRGKRQGSQLSQSCPNTSFVGSKRRLFGQRINKSISVIAERRESTSIRRFLHSVLPTISPRALAFAKRFETSSNRGKSGRHITQNGQSVLVTTRSLAGLTPTKRGGLKYPLRARLASGIIVLSTTRRVARSQQV